MLIIPFTIIIFLAMGILSAGAVSPKAFKLHGHKENTPMEMLILGLVIIGAAAIVVADVLSKIPY